MDQRAWRVVAIWFAVAFVGVALALRVMYVHQKTWEYSLFPSSTPPKVSYHARDYIREVGQARVDAGFVPSGTTMGGGVIYAPARIATAPTVIDVVDGHRIVAYDLMGGP